MQCSADIVVLWEGHLAAIFRLSQKRCNMWHQWGRNWRGGSVNSSMLNFTPIGVWVEDSTRKCPSCFWLVKFVITISCWGHLNLEWFCYHWIGEGLLLCTHVQLYLFVARWRHHRIPKLKNALKWGLAFQGQQNKPAQLKFDMWS